MRKGPCPDCGSKDNLAIYDTHEHCFSEGCGRHIFYNNYKKESAIEDEAPKKAVTGLPRKAMPGLDARGLDATTINKYQVTISQNEESNGEAIFPRFKNEEHVANQVRLKDKQFRVEGSIKGAELFGQHLFQPGGKSVTLTEGYYDALAAYQLTGSRYPNVGVMSSSSAKREIIDNFEWINSFEKIVINFDNDEVGQKAAKEVAQLFTPGQVCIMKLERAKDANDYLMQGLIKEYVNEWWRAAPFMPDGLKMGTQLWDDIKSHKVPHSVPYPWKDLNKQTYGIRRSEVVLLTAETGVGKTSIVKAIEHNLLKNEELIAEGAGIGLLHLEEPKYDTAIGLMSIEAQTPFHLPDTVKSEEELRSAYDAVVNTNRLVIWDHFGSNDIEVVLAKIRHMAALGCKYIVVDHLSIIVSDHSGDERKQLDEISTKIKTLCMNLNIACICVIHLNRQGEIRGSAGPEQIANIVIRLERDKKEANSWRRNITRLTVEKNRFCGRTGPSSFLFYNEDTGCLEELTSEQITQYETGGSGAGHEFEGV